MNIDLETYETIEKYFSDVIGVLAFQAIKKFNDNRLNANRLIVMGGKAIEHMFENSKKSFDWDIHIVDKKNTHNKKKLNTFQIALTLESIMNTFINKFPQYIEYLNNSIRSFNIWSDKKKHGIVEQINKDVLIYFNNSLIKAVKRKTSSGATTTSIIIQLIYNKQQVDLTIIDLVYDTSLPVASVKIDKSTIYNVNGVMYGPFPLILIGLYDMASRLNYKKSEKNYQRLVYIYNSINNENMNCDYQLYLRKLKPHNIAKIFTYYKKLMEKNLVSIKRNDKVVKMCDDVMFKIMESLRTHPNIDAKCYKNIVLISVPDPNGYFEKFNIFPYQNLLKASMDYLNKYDTQKILYKYTEGSSELNSPLILYGLTNNNIFLHKNWWRSGMTIGNTRDAINNMVTEYHNFVGKNSMGEKFYVYKCSRYFNKTSDDFLENIKVGDKIYQYSLNSTSYKISLDKYINFIDIGIPFFVYKISIDTNDANYIIIDEYATKKYNDEGEILLRSDIIFNITNISKKYIYYNDKLGKRYNMVYVLDVNLTNPTLGEKYINNKFVELDDGDRDNGYQCDNFDNVFYTMDIVNANTNTKNYIVSNSNDNKNVTTSGTNINVSAGGYYNKYIKYKKKYMDLKNI